MTAWLLAAALWAQPQDEGRPEGLGAGAPSDEAGQPDLDRSCDSASVFGGSELEQAAVCRLFERKYASLRRLADRALDQDPSSFRAHYLMGMALHLGEANLPKARYHLDAAERLFVERIGPEPDPSSEVSTVLRGILLELVYVHGEMDSHEQKIAYVDRLKEQLDVDYEPLKAWPLMKLGRFEEAKAVAQRAIDSELPYFRAVGKTALCAVESEQRHRHEAYAACLAAGERWLTDPTDGAVELTNAGAAAEEMLRFDQAERFYLTATRRMPEGSVNPYGRLVLLFLRQGRLGEAVSALRAMKTYRENRPGAHLDQQDDAEASMILSSLLLVAGRLEAAERISDRASRQPDRKGTSSAASDQSKAGAALLDRATKLALAARWEERAAASSWWGAAKARWTSQTLRWKAWRAGLVVREVLSDPVRLASTLRPEVPGSIEGPEWLDFDVVELLGPGVVSAVVSDNRSIETLDPELAEPLFAAFEVEAAAQRGRWSEVRERAETIRRQLPPALALIHARVSLREAQAAWAQGDRAASRTAWIEVMRTDPGLTRRLDARLPVQVSAQSGLEALAEVIEASPRFRVAHGGFELQLSRDGCTLATDDGQTLRSVPWPPDALSVDARAVALHDALFAPTVDLTQFDVRSLDGMVGDQVDVSRVLDELSAD
jgi:tetratricopeptide (TPR) repeat protein